MAIQKYIIGDCLELHKEIADKSVDMILTDLPYGVTKNKWDTAIDLKQLWAEWERILDDHGVVVLTACQPYTTVLISSNMKMFKYTWVWKKGNKPTGFLNAKKQPLRITEDIVVFYKNQCTYNPQMTVGKPCHSVGKAVDTNKGVSSNYNIYTRTETDGNLKYPQNIVEFARDTKQVHPTQKPVALFEYLIKTYTNEGDTVLDSCLGSGTTLEACKNTNRNCIGIEIDPQWESVYKKRLKLENDANSLIDATPNKTVIKHALQKNLVQYVY